jgi:CRP-like cAMP-binding protein
VPSPGVACPPEQNRLLGALPSQQLLQLATELVPVRLEAQQTLAFPDEPILHIYFPRDAVISLLVTMEDGKAVEGASVGNEGLVGLQVFLGDGTATDEVVVQIAGEAARMRVSAFRAAVERSGEFQALLQHYTLGMMKQLARTAGCNRLHSVEERCARWLLMGRERVGRDTFPLTHAGLASLLGVRRASVTEAAGVLQGQGLIEYHRGSITIRDPQRLEAAACEDYRLSRYT